MSKPRAKSSLIIRVRYNACVRIEYCSVGSPDKYVHGYEYILLLSETILFNMDSYLKIQSDVSF